MNSIGYLLNYRFHHGLCSRFCFVRAAESRDSLLTSFSDEGLLVIRFGLLLFEKDWEYSKDGAYGE